MSPKYSLDQEFTYKAIYSLQSSIDYYPDRSEDVRNAEDLIRKCRDKLAHKAYANGVIYLKMKDYAASVIYFKNVVDEYYETEWASLSAYQLGVAYALNEQLEQAMTAYRIFMTKYSDHPWRGKAKLGIEKLENSD